MLHLQLVRLDPWTNYQLLHVVVLLDIILGMMDIILGMICDTCTLGGSLLAITFSTLMFYLFICGGGKEGEFIFSIQFSFQIYSW